ncbi:hypothetical protein BJ508DRAFT_310954 [Ascobolus immersus RN42]|uniref:Uncharacterized protein n=1 Tax=Ascobolus immersus RN42 TaxID=1160509 RepID=A0A3N4HVI8_ASCIM|nr:hypothetical protein BJ508DRAFT_310954 [Ascobolus immersus RN42]
MAVSTTIIDKNQAGAQAKSQKETQNESDSDGTPPPTPTAKLAKPAEPDSKAPVAPQPKPQEAAPAAKSAPPTVPGPAPEPATEPADQAQATAKVNAAPSSAKADAPSPAGPAQPGGEAKVVSAPADAKVAVSTPEAKEDAKIEAKGPTTDKRPLPAAVLYKAAPAADSEAPAERENAADQPDNKVQAAAAKEIAPASEAKPENHEESKAKSPTTSDASTTTTKIGVEAETGAEKQAESLPKPTTKENPVNGSESGGVDQKVVKVTDPGTMEAQGSEVANDPGPNNQVVVHDKGKTNADGDGIETDEDQPEAIEEKPLDPSQLTNEELEQGLIGKAETVMEKQLEFIRKRMCWPDLGYTQESAKTYLDEKLNTRKLELNSVSEATKLEAGTDKPTAMFHLEKLGLQPSLAAEIVNTSPRYIEKLRNPELSSKGNETTSSRRSSKASPEDSKVEEAPTSDTSLAQPSRQRTSSKAQEGYPAIADAEIENLGAAQPQSHPPAGYHYPPDSNRPSRSSSNPAMPLAPPPSGYPVQYQQTRSHSEPPIAVTSVRNGFATGMTALPGPPRQHYSGYPLDFSPPQGPHPSQAPPRARGVEGPYPRVLDVAPPQEWAQVDAYGRQYDERAVHNNQNPTGARGPYNEEYYSDEEYDGRYDHQVNPISYQRAPAPPPVQYQQSQMQPALIPSFHSRHGTAAGLPPPPDPRYRERGAQHRPSDPRRGYQTAAGFENGYQYDPRYAHDMPQGPSPLAAPVNDHRQVQRIQQRAGTYAGPEFGDHVDQPDGRVLPITTMDYGNDNQGYYSQESGAYREGRRMRSSHPDQRLTARQVDPNVRPRDQYGERDRYRSRTEREEYTYDGGSRGSSSRDRQRGREREGREVRHGDYTECEVLPLAFKGKEPDLYKLDDAIRDSGTEFSRQWNGIACRTCLARWDFYFIDEKFMGLLAEIRKHHH